jgi:hypothetical protein
MIFLMDLRAKLITGTKKQYFQSNLQLFWTLVIVENIFNAHDVSLQAHFFW